MEKRMKRLSPRTFSIGFFGLLVAIQLIPVWLWQTNPPTQSQLTWSDPQTRTLVQRACYDCHSNQTTWPWYSKVAPVSWLVTWDTVRGRNHLNFDNWNAQVQREPSRLARQVEREVSSGDMPPSYYLWMHPNAKLTPQEQQQLIQGLQQTINVQ
jgi:hypothetical protein